MLRELAPYCIEYCVVHGKWGLHGIWSSREDPTKQSHSVQLTPYNLPVTPGVTSAATGSADSSSKRYSKSKPYYARVVAVDPLCQISSKADKETIRVELELEESGLTYLPGDALGIYPTNNSKVKLLGLGARPA